MVVPYSRDILPSHLSHILAKWTAGSNSWTQQSCRVTVEEKGSRKTKWLNCSFKACVIAPYSYIMDVLSSMCCRPHTYAPSVSVRLQRDVLSLNATRNTSSYSIVSVRIENICWHLKIIKLCLSSVSSPGSSSDKNLCGWTWMNEGWTNDMKSHLFVTWIHLWRKLHPSPSRTSCREVRGQSELMREQKVIGGRWPPKAQLGSPNCNCCCKSKNQNLTGRKWGGNSFCFRFWTFAGKRRRTASHFPSGLVSSKLPLHTSHSLPPAPPPHTHIHIHSSCTPNLETLGK